MKKYRISLHGCDDSTHFERELTSTAFALLKDISIQSHEASTYSCMPIMTVEEITEKCENTEEW